MAKAGRCRSAAPIEVAATAAMLQRLAAATGARVHPRRMLPPSLSHRGIARPRSRFCPHLAPPGVGRPCFLPHYPYPLCPASPPSCRRRGHERGDQRTGPSWMVLRPPASTFPAPASPRLHAVGGGDSGGGGDSRLRAPQGGRRTAAATTADELAHRGGGGGGRWRQKSARRRERRRRRSGCARQPTGAVAEGEGSAAAPQTG
jgi:hypothetical protein